MSRESMIMAIAQVCFPDSPDGHGGYDGLVFGERVLNRIQPIILQDAAEKVLSGDVGYQETHSDLREALAELVLSDVIVDEPST